MYSFYLIAEPRNAFIWVYGLDEKTTDWPGLKLKLREVMAKLHVERGLREARLLLRKHLPGRFFRIPQRRRRVFYSSEDAAYFEVSFNPLNESLTVGRASFTYELSEVRERFYEMERGIRWRVPPAVPRSRGVIATIMQEVTGARYPFYGRRPSEAYSMGEDEERRGLYEPPREDSYARRSVRRRQVSLEERKRPPR